MNEKGKIGIKILMVILIVILASVLVYVNQTPVFFTKAIRLFNKNYEYKTPTVELESTEGVFVTALSDARAVIGTKEGINVYSHSLKSEKSAAFSGENPVIKHNGDKILVFHKGSEKAFFMNGKKNIPITASGNILTGAVNENGYFALLTEEKGFKAEIVVYDKNGEEFYKWHSAENFVTDITLSPSNTAFAASALDYSDGALKSKLLIFDTTQEEPKITDANENFTQIEFIGRSKIAVVSDNAVSVYSTGGNRLWQHSFGNKTVFAYKIKGGKIAAAAGDSNLGTETLDVLMFNDGGKAVVNFKNKGEAVCLDILGNDVLIAGKRYMRVADNKEKWYLKTGKDIVSAQFFGNNKTALVHSGALVQLEYFE